jgi:G3E family GTPase
VVEMSGVADPSVVKANLAAGGVGVARVVTLVDVPAFAEQWMSFDDMQDRVEVPEGPGAVRARTAALATATDLEQDPCAAMRRVVSLLVAQVEAADVIVLNKADMATATELQTAGSVCAALTSASVDAHRSTDAAIITTSFGAAALEALLPLGGTDCAEPGCTDQTHSHGHAHAHGGDCAEPECTDPTHSHGHAHAHGGVPHGLDTTVDGLGIDSFVFSAAGRPLHDGRLQALIQRWPVPVKSTSLDLADLRPGGSGNPAEAASPWEAVLRSKGELWISSRPHSRLQWTFAGRHFSLMETGETWSDPWDLSTRRTDLVVIGLALDEPRLRADLEACVLTDAELLEYSSAVQQQAATEAARAAAGAAHRNPDLRFQVGAAVECNLGDQWARGDVVAHDYCEEGWERGRVAPYQVRRLAFPQ